MSVGSGVCGSCLEGGGNWNVELKLNETWEGK